MAPHADPETSFPDVSYPSNLKNNKNQTGKQWLDGKILDDGAEGLWRIHDGLYDFTNFIRRHPGGQDWLLDTKGTDITEAFESHHISTLPESMLAKFFIRTATSSRHSPFTFKRDGFYRVLKGRIGEELKTVPSTLINKSKRIIEALSIGMFLFAHLACRMENTTHQLVFAIISGVLMCYTVISAHNFVHRRDNWRMYMFNFSFIPSREFRITHALSHHLFPNTLLDYEITSYDSIFKWLPRKTKNFFFRYAPSIYGFVIYAFIFDAQIFRMLREIIETKSFKVLRKEDLVPFTLPLFMYFTTNADLITCLKIWWLIWHVASFFFSLIGLNAAHHHPDIFHDGDTPRQDRDWGLHQLDAVMDRVDINLTFFTVLTNFGEHGLHHLFPTLDHALLTSLHEVFARTCIEFKTELRMTTQLELIIGQFKQLARTDRKTKPRN